MSQPNASWEERRTFRLVYEVRESPERWLLDEDDLPETPDHDLTLRLLCDLLEAWVARSQRAARVARNLACRWDPSDGRIGVDPDVALIEPDCESIRSLGQLRLWEPGHVPPRLAFEVVSASTADKDYREVGARYARLGTTEVWVFDPELFGPAGDLGPCVLSGWRRRGADMVRIYAGDGPAWSDELGAWLVPTSAGRLRIADDEAATQLWLTAGEAAEQRAEQLARNAEQQAQRAEAAEAELARLRALLETRG